MKNVLALVTAVVSVSGCSSIPNLPFTHAERTHRFSYVPIDPAPVERRPDQDCPIDFGYGSTEAQSGSLADNAALKDSSERLRQVGYEFVPLPFAFPDNAVRIAYKTYDAKGNVSYGPVASTGSNQRYQIVIDFINSDVSYYTVDFDVDEVTGDRTVLKAGTSNLRIQACMREQGFSVYPSWDGSDSSLATYNQKLDLYYQADSACATKVRTQIESVKIPVYIGVGLRVVADIVTVKAGAKLGGLPGIAAAADAGAVNGSLVVQTLGINGKSVTSALPLQSELSASSVQSALIAIGSIKTNMYDEDVELRQRIVGFYNSIGATEDQVSAIAGELSANRGGIQWLAPCQKIETRASERTRNQSVDEEPIAETISDAEWATAQTSRGST